MDSTIVNTSFVIVGTNKDGEKVYFAVDHTSGGYPWWSTGWHNVEKFKNKVTASFSSQDYIANQVSNIQILRLDEVVSPFSVTDVK